MKAVIRPWARPICQLCDYISQQPRHQRRLLATSPLFRPQTRREARPVPSLYPAIISRKASTTVKDATKYEDPGTSFVDSEIMESQIHATEEKASIAFSRSEELVDSILESKTAPPEASVKAALEAIEWAVRLRLQLIKDPKASTNAEASSAEALLHLEPNDTSAQTFDYLSYLSQKLLEDPKVFISPQILSTYVTIQSLLDRPSSFPDIFTLYKSKPTAKPNTDPIAYNKPPNPATAKQAIPKEVADLALTSAIKVKALDLALSIIETTYAHPSYTRSKFVRLALPPLTIASALPIGAYALSSKLALFQNSMDPSTATMVAFAGILTYATCTATIGVVAITTANDQMDRVTWALGIPLRERWLREDERAAVDRVAGAWGFSQVWKRGEEEGEEWEALREWVGVRGMVLDATGLMEGME